jgi:hypothetical protein
MTRRCYGRVGWHRGAGTGRQGRVFEGAFAPSTLGSFLRWFTFGQVRQLDAVASRLLTGLAIQAPLLRTATDDFVLLDVDDTVIEVHGFAKQGAGFGYSGVRGLNALLATAGTADSAPVVVAQRLRKGPCGSPRGARGLVADALKTIRGFVIGEAVGARGLSVLRPRPGPGSSSGAGRRVDHGPPGSKGQGGHREDRALHALVGMCDHAGRVAAGPGAGP